MQRPAVAIACPALGVACAPCAPGHPLPLPAPVDPPDGSCRHLRVPTPHRSARHRHTSTRIGAINGTFLATRSHHAAPGSNVGDQVCFLQRPVRKLRTSGSPRPPGGCRQTPCGDFAMHGRSTRRKSAAQVLFVLCLTHQCCQPAGSDASTTNAARECCPIPPQRMGPLFVHMHARIDQFAVTPLLEEGIGIHCSRDGAKSGHTRPNRTITCATSLTFHGCRPPPWNITAPADWCRAYPGRRRSAQATEPSCLEARCLLERLGRSMAPLPTVHGAGDFATHSPADPLDTRCAPWAFHTWVSSVLVARAVTLALEASLAARRVSPHNFVTCATGGSCSAKAMQGCDWDLVGRRRSSAAPASTRNGLPGSQGRSAA